MTPTQQNTPLQTYREMVQTGQLQYSPAQNLVMEKLQLLSNRLLHYTPPKELGFLGSLFGKQQDFLGGLYIFGGVGSGKTMLMDLFYASLNFPQKDRLHFSAFMEQVHSLIKKFRAQDNDDPITAVAEHISQQTVLLCLDEFQVTDITDAMILGRLFQALFGRGLVLVTTGNIAPHNLYTDGINRPLFLPFIDLIEKYTDVIELQSHKDYRRDAIGQDTLWYIAPDAKTNTPYLEQWQRMSAGFTPSAQILWVNGRNLEISLAAGKVARFTFDQICGQPLGRADYLAISQNYSVLFIDDIPVIDQDNLNEARRFTLLVDTLYDANILLVASAHADPDALFPQGRTAEEFKRTASRLIEMSNKASLEK